ncbi:hypothetical protein QE385_003525 [Sphingomonas sp. SORGH_AS 950]|uniref:hypothetical protein n=1 Tax=unclassified Sphingomonas TaxID=196159 RepID=UPI0027840F80|nr:MULTISPECIES: hypothetical protein [unclassified Sphingomonas]MDQ1159198.1 hypothetical protein [Sphingomonas sp. SORGH_AS_0950]MDR6145731.1 hypothetical protein [Sphingomonas sp. SORGH_AS_0870]
MNDPDHKGHKAGGRLLMWLVIALGIAGILLYTFSTRVAEPADEQRAPLNEVRPTAR